MAVRTFNSQVIVMLERTKIVVYPVKLLPDEAERGPYRDEKFQALLHQSVYVVDAEESLVHDELYFAEIEGFKVG